jgi:hypothetical protein
MRAPDPTTVPEADGRRVQRLGQTSVLGPSGQDRDSADVLEPKRRIRLVEVSSAIGRYGWRGDGSDHPCSGRAT